MFRNVIMMHVNITDFVPAFRQKTQDFRQTFNTSLRHFRKTKGESLITQSEHYIDNFANRKLINRPNGFSKAINISILVNTRITDAISMPIVTRPYLVQSICLERQ